MDRPPSQKKEKTKVGRLLNISLPPNWGGWGVVANYGYNIKLYQTFFTTAQLILTEVMVEFGCFTHHLAVETGMDSTS